MGKTSGNGIYLVDEPELIRKKVMRAVTDAGPTKPNQKMSEPIRNLFSLMEIVSTPDTLAHFRGLYNDCTIRYGEMKKQLAEDIIRVCNPLRNRINEILADDAFISKAVAMGREKARASASKTLRDVREIIGFRPF